MTLSGPEMYRRWFEYEKDSHEKVLEALAAVPASKRTSGEFRKAIGLMGHIVAARSIWLQRLGAATPAAVELFPQDLSLPELARRLQEVQARWSAHLDQLADSDLGRSFEYKTTGGEPYRSVVQDVLTQLFAHSNYHRGQIAQLLRAIGTEPPETDFIYWTRTPLAPES